MDILQIVLLGIVASVLYIVLKEMNKSFAFFLILITGIIIFLTIIHQISIIFDLIQSIGREANVDGLYIETILKIIGIAYIAELGANLTKEAGLSAVAKNIELAGKVFIILLAVPILTAIIEAIIKFIPV